MGKWPSQLLLLAAPTCEAVPATLNGTQSGGGARDVTAHVTGAQAVSQRGSACPRKSEVLLSGGTEAAGRKMLQRQAYIPAEVKDRFHVVYICFFMLGLCVLLPWNVRGRLGERARASREGS